MSTLALAAGTLILYWIAYHTYGRWLARKIFRLDDSARVPSVEREDGADFVPTAKSVVFGHHFTSIAGTGPIVGPALAILWGWVPALLWVLFGSIFIGAMHDFATLVVSLRNRGMSVGEIAGRVISPRARLLFLTILLFALWVVLAIFGWVIANVFVQFPESILPVFLQIPIAIWIGLRVHRAGRPLLGPSLAALGLMFLTVWLGAGCPGMAQEGGFLGSVIRSLNLALAALPVWAWVAVLLAYCYGASILPVWVLLQPRDYINSLQLVASLGLLCAGLTVAGLFGAAPVVSAAAEAAPAVRSSLEIVAPAWQWQPLHAPPMLPFLFVTIACGAVSGFHCLVSSGTTSKQLARETDARFVGYGSMLLEGFLATLVILSVAAGLGLGWPAAFPGLSGEGLWREVYSDWKAVTGGKAIAAFVVGSGNFIQCLGIDPVMGRALMGVLVASFAGTTLDTATRLQRYIVQELSATVMPPGGSIDRQPLLRPLGWLRQRHGATLFAVGSAFLLALFPAPGKAWTWETIGTGGLILWPLFGATNQLLAALALLVVAFWLRRRRLPVWFVTLPMVFMLIMPCWALLSDIQRWAAGGSWLLVGVGLGMIGLTAWVFLEGLVLWRRLRAIEPENQAPPPPQAGSQASSRRIRRIAVSSRRSAPSGSTSRRRSSGTSRRRRSSARR